MKYREINADIFSFFQKIMQVLHQMTFQKFQWIVKGSSKDWIGIFCQQLSKLLI